MSMNDMTDHVLVAMDPTRQEEAVEVVAHAGRDEPVHHEAQEALPAVLTDTQDPYPVLADESQHHSRWERQVVASEGDGFAPDPIGHQHASRNTPHFPHLFGSRRASQLCLESAIEK